MKISGKEIKEKWFLFDGCHKFFLIESKTLTKDMKDAGYKQSDVYPIDNLPYMFYNSCPLRFIQTWKGFKRIVPQCRESVTFKGFGTFGWVSKIDFRRNKVYTDEPVADYGYSFNVIFKKMA